MVGTHLCRDNFFFFKWRTFLATNSFELMTVIFFKGAPQDGFGANPWPWIFGEEWDFWESDQETWLQADNGFFLFLALCDYEILPTPTSPFPDTGTGSFLEAPAVSRATALPAMGVGLRDGWWVLLWEGNSGHFHRPLQMRDFIQLSRSRCSQEQLRGNSPPNSRVLGV